MKTTGEKIRESRTHLGLTQTELADKIGVTLRTITKYEKQGVMPRGVNLQRLAEVLGVSTAYLSNDEIVDPNYGLEEAPYIESARAAYGRKGATDVEQLLTQTRALFAGGDVQHRNFVNFLKCPKTLINLRYNFYDVLNLPLIIPHNDIQTVIFKI